MLFLKRVLQIDHSGVTGDYVFGVVEVKSEIAQSSSRVSEITYITP